MTRSWTSLLFAVLASACASSEPICDPSALTAALESAASGDTVRIGACRVEGNFRIPSGVQLVGEGDASVLSSDRDVVVRISADAAASSGLASVRVESAGDVAIFASGAGSATIRDATIVVGRGYGLVARELERLTVERVTVAGPVTGANASDPLFVDVSAGEPVAPPAGCGGILPECTRGATEAVSCPGCGEVERTCDACGRWITRAGAYGIFAHDAGSVVLTDVALRGLALGALVARRVGSLEWRGGECSDVLGVGMLVEDTVTTVTDVEIARTRAGLRPLPPFSAIVSSSGGGSTASLTTQRLQIVDGEGYGLAQIGGTAHHEDVVAARNQLGGMWLADVDEAVLTGTGTLLEENGFAGLLASRVGRLEVTDASIRATRLVPMVVGAGSVLDRIEVGDGVLATDIATALVLERVRLADNARVGLLVDLGSAGTAPALAFDAVEVARGGASGSAGALIGRRVADGETRWQPTAEPGWDTGVVRDADTAAADAAFATELDLIAPGGPPAAEGITGAIGMPE